MKLQVFNGGVSSRLAPQLVQQNQGVVYENIDNAVATLTSIKDKLDTAIASNLYPVYFRQADQWFSFSTPTSTAEFQGRLYTADGVLPRKYKTNGVALRLGIAKPANAPTVAAGSEAKPLKEITAVNTTGGDLPASNLRYRLFNVRGIIYSVPLEFSLSSTGRVVDEDLADLEDVYTPETDTSTDVTTEPTTGRAVSFSNILGEFSDEARLYRYYDGKWRLVHAFATQASTFIDNTEDISANAELDTDLVTAFKGTYQYVYTYYSSGDGAESAPSDVSEEVTLYGGAVAVTGLAMTPDTSQVTAVRLYRVGGNVTQFTLVDEYPVTTSFVVDEIRDSDLDGRLLESDNYNEAPSDLKYLSEAYAMLFGAVGSTLRFTPIGKPDAWPPEYSIQFDDEVTGIGPVANGILVMTRFRTFIVTGTGPTSLSQQTLRGDQGCVNHYSIQEVTEGAVIWASADGLCMSSGNNVENITKHALGEILLNPVGSAAVDEVYYCHNADGKTLAYDYRFERIVKWLDLGIDNIVAANSAAYGVAGGTLHELYKGDSLLPFSYVSPRFSEGSLTQAKTYKKVYFRTDGDIIINILIDDVLVATESLSGKETHQIQVPQELQRGYYIQFGITGTGTVLEYEYEAGNANG